MDLPEALAKGFDVILVTSERVLASQRQVYFSILKCLDVLSLPGRVWVELPRSSAFRKRIMHFPFEILIWDTKVF
jgi:hypothetical protein